MLQSGGHPENSVGGERHSSWRARLGPACRWVVWKWGALLIALAAALAVSTKGQNHHGEMPPFQASLPARSNAGDASFTELALSNLSNSHAVPSVDPSSVSALPSAEACTTLTEEGFHSVSVSAARLMVPGKASSEYRRACGALKDRKLNQAEEHLRKALDVYPNYAAAWVLLGQILEAQQKHADARQACSQAIRVDAAYVPPYLCLADFAAREGDWDQVSVLADRARPLAPRSAFVFYFTAGSQFHFQQLGQAEMNAEAGLKLDIQHQIPELHYLMARIFQAKGDLRNEAIQLQEYLKLASNTANAADAKTLLAQIDLKSEK